MHGPPPPPRAPMITASKDAIRRGAFLTALKYLGINSAYLQGLENQSQHILMGQLFASQGMTLVRALRQSLEALPNRYSKECTSPQTDADPSRASEFVRIREDRLAEFQSPLVCLALFRLVLDRFWPATRREQVMRQLSPFLLEITSSIRHRFTGVQTPSSTPKFSDGEVLSDTEFHLRGQQSLRVNGVVLRMAAPTSKATERLIKLLESRDLDWRAVQEVLRDPTNFEITPDTEFLFVLSHPQPPMAPLYLIYPTNSLPLLIPITWPGANPGRKPRTRRVSFAN